MPGGHGGGRGKPMAQRSPGELWTQMILVTVLANLFVALPFAGRPKPGHEVIWPLLVPLLELQFAVAAYVAALSVEELARRGDQVPARVGRHPYLASFALINAVAVLTAAVGFVLRAVASP